MDVASWNIYGDLSVIVIFLFSRNADIEKINKSGYYQGDIL